MEPSQLRPIERLKTPPSKEEFLEKYMTPGVPVIIEGGFAHWKACEWTLESLRDRVGESTVHVRKNTQCDDYRLGRKYEVVQMKFSNYINRVLANDTTKSKAKREKSRESGASSSTGEKKSSHESIDNFYLAVQNIKRVLPDLDPDISPLPDYVGKLHQGPFLWIAPDEHYEYTHFDPDDGMLFLISGHKEVRLFHWQYLENLYPNPMGSKGRTIQATVNIDEPDLKTHPLFSQVVCDTGTLTDGDLLFIPAFYWHQVTSTPKTISINTFYGDSGDTAFAKKTFDHRFNAAMYWILNVIEQNRGFESFPEVISNLPIALPEFFFKQWHEKVSEEHLQRIIKRILDYCGYTDGPPAYDGPVKKHVQLKIRGLRWRD